MTHAGRAASSPEISRPFSTVCLTVFQLEFRPRTFTIGFYGKTSFISELMILECSFSLNNFINNNNNNNNKWKTVCFSPKTKQTFAIVACGMNDKAARSCTCTGNLYVVAIAAGNDRVPLVTGTLKHVKSSVARSGGIVLRWSSGYGAGGQILRPGFDPRSRHIF